MLLQRVALWGGLRPAVRHHACLGHLRSAGRRATGTGGLGLSEPSLVPPDRT